MLEALSLAAAAAAAWAALVEPRLLRLREVAVATPLWPLPPLRIAVLGDLHAAWPHVPVGRIGQLAQRLADLAPDLVLLTGDYVSTRTWGVRGLPIEPVARALTPLAAAAPTLAVLGNHDWRYGVRSIAAALRAAGIVVLQNEARLVRLGRDKVWVAGVDDMFTRRHDLGAALAGTDRTAPLIVLSHVPDIILDVPAHACLTVAGHTHGGQIRLPLLGPLVTHSALPRHMALGLHEAGERRLYVSGGIGTTGWPVRLGSPPEMAILTLSGSGCARAATPIAREEPACAVT